MNKTILMLHSGKEPPSVVAQLAEAISRRGSTALVRELGTGLYEQVLDAVTGADTVIYWPSEIDA